MKPQYNLISVFVLIAVLAVAGCTSASQNTPAAKTGGEKVVQPQAAKDTSFLKCIATKNSNNLLPAAILTYANDKGSSGEMQYTPGPNSYTKADGQALVLNGDSYYARYSNDTEVFSIILTTNLYPGDDINYALFFADRKAHPLISETFGIDYDLRGATVTPYSKPQSDGLAQHAYLSLPGTGKSLKLDFSPGFSKQDAANMIRSYADLVCPPQ